MTSVALSVPDSLHGLLAARLDALDLPLRSLVADAAVLGTSFSAEALAVVSGRPDDAVASSLAELVRRGVLEIVADPLSPQRGSYVFCHDMLRQVAYETLSRRDRKARHLAVAGRLEVAFADSGDEIMDVIAQHYLDALSAVPDDPDVPEIRAQAIASLVRAAEAAERAGAPKLAAQSFARSADLCPRDSLEAAQLWERAGRAAEVCRTFDDGLRHFTQARESYAARGDERSAARCLSRSGRILRLLGRLAEARTVLADALTILRPEPGRRHRVGTHRSLDRRGVHGRLAGPDAGGRGARTRSGDRRARRPARRDVRRAGHRGLLRRPPRAGHCGASSTPPGWPNSAATSRSRAGPC